MYTAGMNESRQVFCNRCRNQTSHQLLTSYEEHWIDGDPFEEETVAEGCDRYLVLKCRGCSQISLGALVHDPRAEDNFRYQPYFEGWHYFPVRQRRARPEWLGFVTFNVQYPWVKPLIEEVYFAFDAVKYRLAGMSLRTLLDTVMNELVGDIGGFDFKLTAMKTKGHVTEAQADRLAAAVDIGHAAIHRGHVPTEDDIRFSIDFTEHLIAGAFVHPGLVTAIQTPPARLKNPKTE